MFELDCSKESKYTLNRGTNLTQRLLQKKMNTFGMIRNCTGK